MRNKNMMIVLALLAAAALFYFMKQSDCMKTEKYSRTEVATSMDVEMEMKKKWTTIQIQMMTDIRDESMMMMSEEDVD